MWPVAVMLILVGCSSEPIRQFNVDDEQDHSCYGTYGGQIGYCDKRRME